MFDCTVLNCTDVQTFWQYATGQIAFLYGTVVGCAAVIVAIKKI